jgi:hypothetical protein
MREDIPRAIKYQIIVSTLLLGFLFFWIVNGIYCELLISYEISDLMKGEAKFSYNLDINHYLVSYYSH